MAQGVEVGEDGLRLVAPGGYGQVTRQDGVGVEQYLVVLLGGQAVLFLGPVVVAEEAGALADGLGVDVGAGADDAGGVVLGC